MIFLSFRLSNHIADNFLAEILTLYYIFFVSIK